MGNYHGPKSYSTFTHERSMLIKKQNMERSNVAVRYPPYNTRKYNILRFVMVKHPLLLKLKAFKTPIKFLAIIFAILAFYLKRKQI
jgi:aldehyde dehydrogenase (NAD+)